MVIHILLINHNGSAYTINCVNSISQSNFNDYRIYILDNGSKPAEFALLKRQFLSKKNIKIYHSRYNLGFAEGNNLLLRKIIPEAGERDLILFLNNDTEIDQKMLQSIVNCIDFSRKEELIAVKMMHMDKRNEIDNLGITINKSFIGKNRKNSRKETLFCPSGGCAVFSVNCLKKIEKMTGEYFDRDYFCYAEDIDLAFRALHLGFKPKYLPEAKCYHKISATAGGNFNKFIMYHTIRNSLFNITKNMPTKLIFYYLMNITAFQIALIFRYLFTKKSYTLLKVYIDFFKFLPRLLQKRKIIQRAGNIPNAELKKYFHHGYL